MITRPKICLPTATVAERFERTAAANYVPA
jgi:hypothetical protein